MASEGYNREILAIALPAIVSNITTPLLGLVDTAITGHLGAAVYIGAIALGSTMFSMIYWVLNFLRMGSSGLTAQAFGARDIGVAVNVLRVASLIAAVASAVVLVTSPWLADAMLWFMDADAETTSLARKYFMIVAWGAPAVLGTYALTGWMLGMQDSRSPMWMALTTNVVNIAVSLVLVYVAHMKIAGIALGTVTAQWAGLVLGVVLALRLYRRQRKSIAKGVNDSPAAVSVSVVDTATGTHVSSLMRRFFRVNTDIFLRTLCLVAVTVWFTKAGARMGQDILAANALLMQLFILFSYFMDGFAFAGEALSGKYLGAGHRERLRGVIRAIFKWGVCVVVLFTMVYLVGGEWIVTILTDDYHVRATATSYLLWAVAVPFAGVASFVWDGVMIGLTQTRSMLVAMLIAMLIFFLLYFLLTPAMGNHGLWLAFVAYLLTRGAVQTILFKGKK